MNIARKQSTLPQVIQVLDKPILTSQLGPRGNGALLAVDRLTRGRGPLIVNELSHKILEHGVKIETAKKKESGYGNEAYVARVREESRWTIAAANEEMKHTVSDVIDIEFSPSKPALLGALGLGVAIGFAAADVSVGLVAAAAVLLIDVIYFSFKTLKIFEHLNALVKSIDNVVRPEAVKKVAEQLS